MNDNATWFGGYDYGGSCVLTRKRPYGIKSLRRLININVEASALR